MASKRPPNVIQRLPDGQNVEFWDAVGLDGANQQRRYRVDGEKFTSISTVAGVYEKFGLLPAAVKLQEEGVIALARDGVDIATFSPEELRALLIEYGLHYDSVWGVARERGDIAHEHLLHLLRDEKVAKLSEYEADLRPWITAGMKFALDTRPKVRQAECMVADAERRVAGRFDLFAEARDGALERIDFKTVTAWKVKRDSKGRLTDELYPPFSQNLMQIIGYERTARACGYDPADRLKVVRLGPDGEYDVTEVPYRPDAWDATITAYRCQSGLLKPLEAVAA